MQPMTEEQKSILWIGTVAQQQSSCLGCKESGLSSSRKKKKKQNKSVSFVLFVDNNVLQCRKVGHNCMMLFPNKYGLFFEKKYFP